MAEPQLPTVEDIAKLPRWARVAFAARCARRALRQLKHRPDAPRNHVEAVTEAVEIAERFAAQRAATAAYDAYGAAHAAYAAPAAAIDAAYAANPTPYAVTAVTAANAAGVQVPLIAADFQALSRAATQGHWTDDTPVPPEVFEPKSPETFLPWQQITEAMNAATAPPILQEARRNEDQALQKNYPGEYVAYQDIWEPPVLRREVLAHARSLKAVHAELSHLPENILNLVRVTYCDDPSQFIGFRGGYDNPSLQSSKGKPKR